MHTAAHAAAAPTTPPLPPVGGAAELPPAGDADGDAAALSAWPAGSPDRTAAGDAGPAAAVGEGAMWTLPTEDDDGDGGMDSVDVDDALRVGMEIEDDESEAGATADLIVRVEQLERLVGKQAAVIVALRKQVVEAAEENVRAPDERVARRVMEQLNSHMEQIETNTRGIISQLVRETAESLRKSAAEAASKEQEAAKEEMRSTLDNELHFMKRTVMKLVSMDPRFLEDVAAVSEVRGSLAAWEARVAAVETRVGDALDARVDAVMEQLEHKNQERVVELLEEIEEDWQMQRGEVRSLADRSTAAASIQLKALEERTAKAMEKSMGMLMEGMRSKEARLKERYDAQLMQFRTALAAMERTLASTHASMRSEESRSKDSMRNFAAVAERMSSFERAMKRHKVALQSLDERFDKNEKVHSELRSQINSLRVDWRQYATVTEVSRRKLDEDFVVPVERRLAHVDIRLEAIESGMRAEKIELKRVKRRQSQVLDRAAVAATATRAAKAAATEMLASMSPAGRSGRRLSRLFLPKLPADGGDGDGKEEEDADEDGEGDDDASSSKKSRAKTRAKRAGKAAAKKTKTKKAAKTSPASKAVADSDDGAHDGDAATGKAAEDSVSDLSAAGSSRSRIRSGKSASFVSRRRRSSVALMSAIRDGTLSALAAESAAASADEGDDDSASDGSDDEQAGSDSKEEGEEAAAGSSAAEDGGAEEADSASAVATLKPAAAKSTSLPKRLGPGVEDEDALRSMTVSELLDFTLEGVGTDPATVKPWTPAEASKLDGGAASLQPPHRSSISVSLGSMDARPPSSSASMTSKLQPFQSNGVTLFSLSAEEDDDDGDDVDADAMDGDGAVSGAGGSDAGSRTPSRGRSAHSARSVHSRGAGSRRRRRPPRHAAAAAASSGMPGAASGPASRPGSRGPFRGMPPLRPRATTADKRHDYSFFMEQLDWDGERLRREYEQFQEQVLRQVMELNEEVKVLRERTRPEQMVELEGKVDRVLLHSSSWSSELGDLKRAHSELLQAMEAERMRQAETVSKYASVVDKMRATVMPPAVAPVGPEDSGRLPVRSASAEPATDQVTTMRQLYGSPTLREKPLARKRKKGASPSLRMRQPPSVFSPVVHSRSTPALPKIMSDTF